MTGPSSTPWEAVAGKHVGHRCVLRDARTLECVDCSHKLLLPKDSAGATPVPEQFTRPRVEGVPMPGNFRARVQADLEHKRRLREEADAAAAARSYSVMVTRGDR